MNEIMNLPPIGFFFIVKHASVNNIPTVFFALQEDGTSNTVSFQMQAVDIGLSIENLNKVLDTLTEEWNKEHSATTPKVEAEVLQFSSSAISTHGEMI